MENKFSDAEQRLLIKHLQRSGARVLKDLVNKYTDNLTFIEANPQYGWELMGIVTPQNVIMLNGATGDIYVEENTEKWRFNRNENKQWYRVGYTRPLDIVTTIPYDDIVYIMNWAQKKQQNYNARMAKAAGGSRGAKKLPQHTR